MLSQLIDTARRGWQAVVWHYRVVAAVAAGVAVLTGVSAVHPRRVPTAPVWAASQDLAAGTALTASEVSMRQVPVADLPAGALAEGSSPIGQVLAAPVRAGELLTDVRMLGPGLLSATRQPGLVAVPVRIGDGAAAAALVAPGERVDVLVTPAGATHTVARVVAADITVLSVPTNDATAGDQSGLVIVAVSLPQAGALAAAATTGELSLALRAT